MHHVTRWFKCKLPKYAQFFGFNMGFLNTVHMKIVFWWFKFTLKPSYSIVHDNIISANLGHFPLEFFCQIWTQETLFDISLLVNFDICQFLVTPGPLE